MKRKEFIAGGLSAFVLGTTGKMFGADAPSNRVRLAVMGCHPKGRGFALRTGEVILSDAKTGRLDPRSAGKDLWAREYEKGWELV